MKYYLDTEFIEGFHKPLFGKRRHHIDLISIGIVREDGREYSAISSEYKYDDASDWVKENVIRPLYKSKVHGDARNNCDETNFHKYYGRPHANILHEIRNFFGVYNNALYDTVPDGIEVYGYFCDYDWVLFCSLFGRMIDLPKGFPMYCRDLKQELDNLADSGEMSGPTIAMSDASNFLTKERRLMLLKEHTNYPKQTEEHDALADAKWNYQLHRFINSFKKMHNVSE
jgi:hypothetical protein